MINDTIKSVAEEVVGEAKTAIQGWQDAADAASAASRELKAFRVTRQVGEDARERTLRDAELSLAAEAARDAQRAAEAKARAAVADAKKGAKARAAAALDAAYAIDPAALDPALTALIGSGVLGDGDYAALIEKYADNPTCERVVTAAADRFLKENNVTDAAATAAALVDYRDNGSREGIEGKLDLVLEAIDRCTCSDWFSVYDRLLSNALNLF